MIATPAEDVGTDHVPAIEQVVGGVTRAACNGGAGQSWSPYTDGTLRTQGGCLDVVAAGKTSGTNVDWYPCNASAAQGWTAQANGELVNPNSGLCLTVPGGNTGRPSHTTDIMRAAVRMYERLGYVRTPEHDFSPAAGVLIKGYRLDLRA